jgi:amidase
LRFARRWLPGIAQSASGLPSSRLEPRTRKMARAGRTLELLHLAASQDENLARILLEYFRGSDLLVTPTLATSPPLLDAFAQHGWLRTSLAVGNWICTLPWNLTDFPAASVPAGLTEAGLPIGLQVVAPPGGEHAILSLMRQIEVLQPFPALPVH